jgi:hypothetical protein
MIFMITHTYTGSFPHGSTVRNRERMAESRHSITTAPMRFVSASVTDVAVCFRHHGIDDIGSANRSANTAVALNNFVQTTVIVPLFYCSIQV